MSYVCPELANANNNDLNQIVQALNNHVVGGDPNAPYMAPPLAQTGAHGANVIFSQNQQERIFFYHVDSCIAIIFILNNGMVVGGHAGIIGVGVPNGEPQAVILDMQGLVPAGVEVDSIHIVGDIDSFYPNIDAIIGNEFPDILIVHYQEKTPINVTVFHEDNWDIQVIPYVNI